MITIKGILTSFYVLTLAIVLTSVFYLNGISQDTSKLKTDAHFKNANPTSLEMYNLIEKYADMYGVPRHIAYNIAYLESRYKGPFDWSYKPSLESSAGAVGPMQVMTSTAKFINKKVISKHELKTNIEVNIKTSMKLLNFLYKQYGDWATVCGCYNTGSPIINGYARFCVSNKDYSSNWVFYQR